MDFIPFDFKGKGDRVARAPLYPVVESVALIETLLKLGVTTIQLRLKKADDPQLEAQIVQAIALGEQYQAQVVINDYWQLALKHGAFAVHLGQEDLIHADLDALKQAGIRLGVSTRTFAELQAAIAMKPSYLAIGHIFPTPTKQMSTPPQGLKQLKQHVEFVRGRIPTVAIGGIDLEKATEVWQTGVDSLAVVRAITQSADLAQTLEQFSQVFTVMERTKPAELSAAEFIRYSRQLMLPEVEETGQQQLKQSKVLIVGAGGLGSIAAMYLAGGGVGQLLIADGDQLELSNLPRQLAYQQQDIGRNKAQALKAQLLAQNPDIEVTALNKHLEKQALEQTIASVDLVLDCSDNLPTRQAINAICLQQQKILISGAAIGWQGQLMLFDFQNPAQACYQCVFPDPSEQAQNCASLGVIGPVVGAIASQQALLAMKAILGLPLAKQMTEQKIQLFDGLNDRWQSLNVSPNRQCPLCAQVSSGDLTRSSIHV